MTPQYIQWTIPSLLYKTRRNNSLVQKRLIQPEVYMMYKKGELTFRVLHINFSFPDPTL